MRGSELAGRAALVLGGFFLSLLLLEGALQLGALAVRARGRELPAAAVSGRFRVLCIGDSNTYGLWLERSEAYPRQLEALWNEEVERPKVEVFNLGIPGMNSSQVARDLPRLVETFNPDLVIVMIGANDFWTRPVEIEGGPGVGRGPIRRYSLVYKLALLLIARLDAPELEVVINTSPEEGMRSADNVVRYGGEEFDLGFVRADDGRQGDARELERNLRIVSEQGSTLGVPLYLMTYPGRWSFYGSANPVIIDVAQQTGTPVIDLTDVFRPLCPVQDCPQYLFSDQHPNAAGYRIVAETIAERLAGSDRHPAIRGSLPRT